MASIAPKTHYDVTFTIPVKQSVEHTADDRYLLNLRANTKPLQRFIKRLGKLCKKYGYTLGETKRADNTPQNAVAFYLCDGTACANCCPDVCKHTSNIAHAKNFCADIDGQSSDGAPIAQVGFFEKDITKQNKE